jgi:cholesterol transport system auxiliary component
VLGGELTRFEHLPTADPPRVRADLTLTLMRSSDRGSLLAKGYQAEEAVGGASPEDMAAAFNRLASRLIREVVGDLARLRRHAAAVGRAQDLGAGGRRHGVADLRAERRPGGARPAAG